MGFVDTGLNVPESLKTLQVQQAQLLAGKRHVQMFPAGLNELPLPKGFARHQNQRGIFHFLRSAISPNEIDRLGFVGRENEILNLGPYNKSDIAAHMERGEKLVAIAEFDRDGVEVRAAAATASTLPEQARYFEATKDEGNKVEILDMADLLAKRL